MILFIIAAALSTQQQAQHDAVELAMYRRLQTAQNQLDEIWRPNSKLLSDVRSARRCYTKFHLYRVEGCKAEFDKVDADLAAAKE
jgi:hypothetical protein